VTQAAGRLRFRQRAVNAWRVAAQVSDGDPRAGDLVHADLGVAGEVADGDAEIGFTMGQVGRCEAVPAVGAENQQRLPAALSTSKATTRTTKAASVPEADDARGAYRLLPE
jgi:hypothetical protein